MKNFLRSLVPLLMVALFVALPFLPVGERLRSVPELGWWGLVLLAALYTPAAFLLGPSWLLTLSLGYFYGVFPGFVAA